MRSVLVMVLVGFVLLAGSRLRDDVVIADFEGRDYGAWVATGTAFGPGPAPGAIDGQMPVSNFMGHGLVNSFFGGDEAEGTLTSPEFAIQRKYINFMVGGGNRPGDACINLLVDGKVAHTTTGRDNERLDWASWEVSKLEGHAAKIEIVDHAKGGWGHINVDEIVMSDTAKAEPVVTDVLYNETYRPQFHFSSKTNWLNDPNGLVYDSGEYHLFFQHNPDGINWGNMTWGHAVSKDLVHWEQLQNALLPDKLGTMFSGSAVVDHENTSGFGSGKEAPMVAMYTAAGGNSPESQGVPFSQCIAYSVDKGRTWTKYSGNPVIPHIIGGNRDPKLVWHAPTHKWIVALYLDGNDYGLFSSPDLKQWTQIQKVNLPGCSECPDFFEIPIAGTQEQKWVFTAANGNYLAGSFDGKTFTPEQAVEPEDRGANYYAVQTYSDIPPSDGRRIQIAWMNGGSYPEMPFNQQMSFPCVLTLHRTPEGLRLFRWPVKEIQGLYTSTHNVSAMEMTPSDNPLHDVKGDTFDVQAEFRLKDASAFGFKFHGQTIRYDVRDKTVTCLGRTAHLAPQGDHVRLRLLLDRSSIELYGNDGQLSMTSCYLPTPGDHSLSAYTEGGNVDLISMQVHSLRSAWPQAKTSTLASSAP